MVSLVVQLQVRDDREDVVLLNYVRGIIEQTGVSWEEDRDEKLYSNFTVTSSDIRKFWLNFLDGISVDPQLKSRLQNCWIVVVQGKNGWDDYLTLAHFDDSVELDEVKLISVDKRH